MKVARTRVARAIADRTLKQGVSRRLSRELAAYLLSERRTGELDSLLRDIQADWAEAGHVEVIAASAFPLTAAVRSDITRRVKAIYPRAKQVIINEVHDPTVVGGVRLSLPDRQLDLSIRTKLNRFKQLATAGKD
ncbi:MAG TPA: F0F1 ATP synthase subunit delta [Candidatus Saccharimonadales bacterium]|nr:F0F1 ATP synthase subunit delta [Candidatus Saccharimonadales bacterium]